METDIDLQAAAELELLAAMFPVEGELLLRDEGWPINIALKLQVDDLQLEMTGELERGYPITRPLLMARAQDLSGPQQRQLNQDLANHIATLPSNETCIVSAVSWLQDNAYHYQSTSQPCIPEPVACKTFSRIWIYSHHIYSTTKRKDILSLASENNLTGFMLSGKPGVICIEGETFDCDEWWTTVKAMNWKRIGIKKREDFDSDCDFVQKFKTFEEISFRAETNRTADVHTDMGEFYKYLLNLDCGYIFTDMFGINGKQIAT